MKKILCRFVVIFFIIIFLIYSIISKRIIKSNKNLIKKKILLSKIFKRSRRNINNISTLFINGKAHFGNYFIGINNAIIYCEILGCKKITIIIKK